MSDNNPKITSPLSQLHNQNKEIIITPLVKPGGLEGMFTIIQATEIQFATNFGSLCSCVWAGAFWARKINPFHKDFENTESFSSILTFMFSLTWEHQKKLPIEQACLLHGLLYSLIKVANFPTHVQNVQDFPENESDSGLGDNQEIVEEYLNELKITITSITTHQHKEINLASKVLAKLRLENEYMLAVQGIPNSPVEYIAFLKLFHESNEYCHIFLATELVEIIVPISELESVLQQLPSLLSEHHKMRTSWLTWLKEKFIEYHGDKIVAATTLSHLAYKGYKGELLLSKTTCAEILIFILTARNLNNQHIQE